VVVGGVDTVNLEKHPQGVQLARRGSGQLAGWVGTFVVIEEELDPFSTV